MNDLEWHLQPTYCSTVRHSLPFKVLLQTSIHRFLSSTGRGEQDGVVFHCAVTVILHTLKRIYTYFRRGHIGYDILPDRLERADRLVIRP